MVVFFTGTASGETRGFLGAEKGGGGLSEAACSSSEWWGLGVAPMSKAACSAAYSVTEEQRHASTLSNELAKQSCA